MFNISWSEFIVIMVAVVTFTDPKDIPALVKRVQQFWQTLKNTGQECLNVLQGDNSVSYHASQVNRDLEKITDLEGKLQEVYDISDFLPKKDES